MRQFLLKLMQLGIFAGLSAWIYSGLITSSHRPDGTDAGAALILAGVLLMIGIGIVTKIQNWLVRRRGRRINRSLHLAEESYQSSDRLGRAGPSLEDGSEVIEISPREQLRQIRRSLP